MSKGLYLFMVFLLALCIPIVCSAQRKHKDRVIWTKHVQGKLVGFEVGDYMHAEIRTTAGKRMSFFLGPYGLDYFLAVHHGKTFDLTYILVDSYIEEAGGYQRITRLTDARAGKTTFKRWITPAVEGMPDEEVQKMYGTLVDKLILNKEDESEAPTGAYSSADTLIYDFRGPPVSPAYQTNYTITLTAKRIQFAGKADGFRDTTKNITAQQFNDILSSLSASGIRRGDRRENDGCAGGSSESIKVMRGGTALLEASAYHCGGQQFGDLVGDLDPITKRLSTLLR